MIVVRKVTSDELEEYKNIRIKVFVEEQQVPLELEIDDLDNNETTTHVAIFKNNKMIGTGRILDSGSSKIHLGRIAILKDFRGIGLGNELVLGLEKIAKDMTVENVTSYLSAQIYAEKFYSNLGYKRENDNVYLDAGIEHIDMFKKL